MIEVLIQKDLFGIYRAKYFDPVANREWETEVPNTVTDYTSYANYVRYWLLDKCLKELRDIQVKYIKWVTRQYVSHKTRQSIKFANNWWNQCPKPLPPSSEFPRFCQVVYDYLLPVFHVFKPKDDPRYTRLLQYLESQVLDYSEQMSELSQNSNFATHSPSIP